MNADAYAETAVNVKTEADRFIDAFEAILERGEFPSPGALNREQGFDVRRSIPGRLTGLRQYMLIEAGYFFDESVRRWRKRTVPEVCNAIEADLDALK